MTTYTPHLKLRKPDIGQPSWGDEMHDNSDIEDFILGGLKAGNVVLDGCAPSDGGGLVVDYAGGTVIVAGARHAIAAGSKTCTGDSLNWLCVDDAGVVQLYTTPPTAAYAPLAMIDAGATAIDRIADCRVVMQALGDADTLDGFTADDFAIMAGFQTNGRHASYTGDLDDIAENSLYNITGGSATNAPSWLGSNWAFILTSIHTNGTDWRTQLCWNMNNGALTAMLSMRRMISGVWGAWQSFYSPSNDGPGSGLDADTLDGQEGAYYARADRAFEYWTTGSDIDTVLPGSTTGTIYKSDGLNHVVIGIRGNDPNDGFYVIDTDGQGLTGPFARLLLAVSPSQLKYLGNTIWHAGNDGSGSGLDADTLDGVEGVSFVRKDAASNINSNINITIGSGEGAVRMIHDPAVNRFYFVPYNGGDWDWDKQLGFDADEDQWHIEGAPLAGGNQIATVADPFLQGFKNLIINGAMQISQRGTSFTGITNGGSQYTLDRWYMVAGGAPTGVLDVKQTADHPTAPNGKCLEIDVTTAQASPAAADYFRLEQRIEGQNLQNLLWGGSNAQPLALSFWVKSHQTGAHGVSLYHNDALITYATTYTVNAADTWEYKTITIPGETANALDNDNNSSLRVFFDIMGGSGVQNPNTEQWGPGTGWSLSGNVNILSSTSNNLRFAGIQLEAGEVATPFESLPHGVTLHQCKRYYEEFNYDSTNFLGACVTFYNTTLGTISGLACEVEKRTADAAITIANLKFRVINTRYALTVTDTDIDHDRRILHITVAPGSAKTIGYSYPIESTNDLKITVDAEL